MMMIGVKDALALITMEFILLPNDSWIHRV